MPGMVSKSGKGTSVPFFFVHAVYKKYDITAGVSKDRLKMGPRYDTPHRCH